MRARALRSCGGSRELAERTWPGRLAVRRFDTRFERWRGRSWSTSTRARRRAAYRTSRYSSGEVTLVSFEQSSATGCRPKQSTCRSSARSPHIRSPVMTDEPRGAIDVDEMVRRELETQLSAVARALPDRINADPERVDQGLARLVLTVIEVVRKVLEHQAVRRMDGGDLNAEEVERLGLTLLKLDERMQQLKEAFGLTDEDLQIDLGPLGRLR